MHCIFVKPIFPQRTRSVSVLPLFLLSVLLTSGLTLRAQLSPQVQREMAEVYAFKQSFTPAEKKMTSNLVLMSRAAQHQPLNGMARFLNYSRKDEKGLLLVEVTATLTPSLKGMEAMKDVDLSTADPRSYVHSHVKAHLRENQLLELASHPDVVSLSEDTGHSTNVGSVTSQGYVTHGVNKVIAGGIDGTGVKVGVLSDSASAARVAALINSGDLPADVVVLPGQTGPSSGADEGAAMMEIVHDMAPGAKLFFATADNGVASFAANIRALRNTYGCDIIVDDVTYFNEGVFQDGPIAQAVNDVTASGALYFSSAANSGNLTSGTSGTWEGDFLSAGAISGPIATSGETGLVHNFGTAISPQSYDTLTAIANGYIVLKWADPLGGATDDYDLFVLNSTGTTVKGFSAGSQTGTQDPYEIIGPGASCGTASASGYCTAVGDRIVVVKFGGNTVAMHLDTERAMLSIATAGATFGHNAAGATFSMAADYWNSGKKGAKLYTGGAANPIETFSSDGPRQIFFTANGTAITPGQFTFASGGGTMLQKPDATAADGVSTATPGFTPFFGTSAAAPHAAGIAALVKSANLSLTNAQIRSILTGNTLDIMAPGIDRDSGYGLLMAPQAVLAAQQFVQP